MRDKMITISKVVTKNFVSDWWASIQNIIGSNLTTYENMSKEAIKQIQDELEEQDIKLKWFRYEITQLTNGALMVMLYGEKK